jgi:hypothetical protein
MSLPFAVRENDRARKHGKVFHLLSARFNSGFLLGSFSDTEERGITLLRNID